MTRPKKNAPPDLDSPRVIHGGSWHYFGPSWVRAASRDSRVPAYRHNNIGFRTTLSGRVKQ